MKVTLVLVLTLVLTVSTALSKTFRNYEQRDHIRRPSYILQDSLDPCANSCDPLSECCSRLSISSNNFDCQPRRTVGQSCDPSLMPGDVGCPCMRGSTCLPVYVSDTPQFACQPLPPIDPDEKDFAANDYQ